MKNPNQWAIDRLKKLDYEVSVFIFDRPTCEMYSDQEVEMTDEEWEESHKTIDEYFMGQSEWENLYACLSEDYKDRCKEKRGW